MNDALPQEERWWQRYPVRLSVRAVMALVLILAAGLAWVVHRARSQANAVREITRAGGAVMYDDQFAVSPATPRTRWRAPRWVVDRLGKDYFFTVVAARLSGPEVDDAGLGAVGSLQHLHSLNLDSDRVGDDALAHLKGLGELQRLIILNTPVGDDALAHLEGLGGLRMLVLQDTRVSDEGALRLKRALPRVEIALDRTKPAAARAEGPQSGSRRGE